MTTFAAIPLLVTRLSLLPPPSIPPSFPALVLDCTDLLQKLLTSNPSERIKMEAVMEHPWLNKGCRPLRPAPFPNKLTANDLNEDIVEHITYILKVSEGTVAVGVALMHVSFCCTEQVKPTEEEVKEELLANRASSTTAIYHLLSARLDRWGHTFTCTFTHVHKQTGIHQ